jgi:hypothetical protein
MADIIQLRGGTAAAWTAANPVLAEKEMGVETDTRLMKLGDGITAWNDLPYLATGIASIIIDGDGDMIITLTNGDEINAGSIAGPPGTDGADGTDGTSITGVSVNWSNHLIVTLSTGATVDAGLLPAGPAGADGADGTNGTSITGVAIDGSSHLIVTLSTGGTVDAGLLPAGAAGADGTDGADGTNGTSITGVAINGSNHLIVTLSTGGPIDAGLLPAGADGADGADGTGITPQAVGFTLSGGTTPKTVTADIDLVLSAVATKTGIETLTNKTLTVPTITGFTESGSAPAAGTAFTVDLTNGTDHEITINGNATITLPAAASGKSYTVRVIYAGAYVATFAGGTTIRWAGGTPPAATSVNGKFDDYVFRCNRAGTITTGYDGGRNI